MSTLGKFFRTHLPFAPALGLIAVMSLSGCWAPLRYSGIPAPDLPDSFRMPLRAASSIVNLSQLTIDAPLEYRLGHNDILEVTVPKLYTGSEARPLRVQVTGRGNVHLPLIGAVSVGDLTIAEAQQAISRLYADGFLKNASVGVILAQKATINVVVLGAVNKPGVVSLPKYENDVGHALAMAGGLTEYADDVVEVHHRRSTNNPLPNATAQQIGRSPTGGALSGRHFANGYLPDDIMRLQMKIERNAIQLQQYQKMLTEVDSPAVAYQYPLPASNYQHFEPTSNYPICFGPSRIKAPGSIVRIPLRSLDPSNVDQKDVTLQPGDVVVVHRRTDEVFYVVGRLSTSNFVRFTIGDRERELGAGFILPRDRDIDVVKAVTMAGYIDPISSPTTVTVHRVLPDGEPILIVVDLIKARYDRKETIMVQPGDIMYLNPDFAWWFRMTFDRIVDDLITIPYDNAIVRPGR